MSAYTVSHEVGGFRVVPVKFSEKSSAGHMLYYKEHSVKESEDTKPTDRTLFVVNVPPYCNEECLQRLFGGCGGMESVILQAKAGKELDAMLEEIYPIRKTRGFKIAYIVFKDDSSVVRAMKQKYKEPFILSPEGEPGGLVTGYRKWCSEYEARWEDPKQLQKKADDFMIEFDKRKHEEKEQAKVEEGVPDDDGWVTVTRKSTKPVVARSERKQKRLQAKEKKKREEKELMNFYTFQSRESKREHIAELRMKFEEDKQRITQMRAARKFKPY
ncbi:ribosomal RNA-processing protein 7 homolog A [Strongylocentrotus purpuratus]|uniref:Ribosomal RNA-processing protein 7 homolog A n=1 Tax=Strongylocentrotus purpuratus TaxID=7668 RepID=A0A7M7PVQ1_STRPU|nr:ribosomal RNA-processing protein 7 homolog A [Strongylocentrotus purpuratus]